MKFSHQTLVLSGVGVLLLLGVTLQGLNVRDVKEGDRSKPAAGVRLAERVPHNLATWPGRDEPLGPNEVTRTAVERTLNYDDFVFRVFKNGDREIGVYVAYWGPGRMPLQKVASHTPDRCWTENGWKCEEMRFSEVVSTDGVNLMPAQWRRFTPPNGAAQQYVVYWHLVGTRLYEYGARFNARPDLVKWWRDTLDYAFSGSEAQYFIRVTSNRPFEEFAGDPAWRELVGSLVLLGLEGKAAARH